MPAGPYPSNPATIEIQDMTNDSVDLRLTRKLGDITLAGPTAQGDTIITLDTRDHEVLVGDIICFKQDSRFYQGIALVVDQDKITLDSPLDHAFTPLALGSRNTGALNVNGAVTPVTFSIGPASGTAWHILQVRFGITDGSAMDDALFGGITALTKGVLIRRKDGTYKNLFNLKSNTDFLMACQSAVYADKAPSGSYGFRAVKDYQVQHGVVISLDGTAGAELELVVQDDLTGLTSFRVNVIGHVVRD